MKRIYITILLCILAINEILSQSFIENNIRYQITSGNEPLSVEVTRKYPIYEGYIIVPSAVVFNGNTYAVTSIGDYAFDSCTGLTSIEIPNSVTSIGRGAFIGCTGLTSIEIPNSVTSIGNAAFNGCTGLTSIGIPNSVTSIGNAAFFGCTGLTSIEIPNSVTSIGDWTFSNCTELATINVASDNNFYASLYGVLYNKDLTTLVSCPAGKTSISIPVSVTSIGNSAFYGCTGLTSIEIPNSVTSIGNSAFCGCTELTTIDVASDNNFYSSLDGVLYNKDLTTLVCCPAGKTSVSIPSSVTSIGDYAFYGCTGLTSIEIPNSVTSIGINAFRGCTGLTSIEIPSSVTSIGDYAFCGCTELTFIKIPNSVISIGDWAFYNCCGLTSIEIPSSVTSIGHNAFVGCTGLTSIEIPNSVTSIGDWAFDSCTGLTLIEIPNSVTSIGDGTFYNCSGLTSIEIPSSVTSIGRFAFYNCSDFTYIKCHAISPPSLGLNVFIYVPKTIPLYVPNESISDYQAATQWNDFLDIRPLTTVSIEPMNSRELAIYPNPAHEIVFIRGFEENATVKIFDLKGHLMFSTGNIQENQRIDVRFLPSGIYVFEVIQNGKSSFHRVVKD